MPKHTSSTETEKICAAALQLAATKGWENVTLEAVAKAAKISPAVLKTRFVTTADIAALIVAETGNEVLVATKKASGAVHDILFDRLMARFDILQKNRKGTLSIAAAAKHDRRLSLALARAVAESLSQTTEGIANLSTPRPLLATGLIAVYGWAFAAWSKDESRDMAKTMAALDRALRLAGKAAGLLKRRS